MFNRFTERARKVLLLAKEEARRFNHDYIGTEHILLALITEREGVAAVVLQNLGVNLDVVRHETEKLMHPDAQTQNATGDLPFTPRAKKVLELSAEEARNMGHNYIGTEHILLGMLKEKEGVASQILMGLGIDLEIARKSVIELLGGTATAAAPAGAAVGGAQSQQAAGGNPKKTPALDSFGRDLTEMARQGMLDPVVGRAKEISRLVLVLARRTKNNPVLLGEAGVGKTAIVEGLAQAVASGTVPEVLRDKRIIALDLALMVAGTKYRGQFEERIKALMDEIKRAKDVVLFIDEIHTIVGAGAAEGAIDASNILKPALSRGEIQCIGATTLDEYRKYIEKDAALERRFQSIFVDPPSVEETIQILKGLRDKYEAHHRVNFTDEALVAAATLSERYISGRFLPDKAVDLIDEAGSRARMTTLTIPSGMKELEDQLTTVSREKESFIKQQDFESAARLRDQEREVKLALEQQRKEWQQTRDKDMPQVGPEQIAVQVAEVTGIPVVRLEQNESNKLMKMEDVMGEKVKGQEDALKIIARALRRSRSGIKDPKRPIGSFMFLGPTGVGKTMLARTLAEFMFGNDEALIQIDMSEYMEKFNVTRLVGAPPGYVGYEEGGQLSERVRRKPYSVVLLDEIEKAHPDVFNLLLQILEEGRMTDSYGRKIDFRNTVLIMTSNVGVDLLKKKGSLGFISVEEEIPYERMKESLTEEVKKTFKPEFLNRLDDVVVFRPLSKDSLVGILENEVAYVNVRLKEQLLSVVLDEAVKTFFLEKGFDPVYGARPIKRVIQKYLEDPLSEEMISGTFKDRVAAANGGTVQLTVKMKDKESVMFE